MLSNHLILCRPLLLLSLTLSSISFPVSQLFTSSGWSIGALAPASVLPVNIQGWFSLGLPGSISSQFRGLSRVFCSTTTQKHPFFRTQPSLWTNSYVSHIRASQVAQVVKNWPTNAGDAGEVGDVGSIPGSGRSPGQGNGHPLQYACLGNPLDGGARRAPVHGAAKSQKCLNIHKLCTHLVEKMNRIIPF